MAKKNITYAEAVREIEEIVARFEKDEPDIDRLAEQVKRAGELIALCREKLRTTEEEIGRILNPGEERES